MSDDSDDGDIFKDAFGASDSEDSDGISQSPSKHKKRKRIESDDDDQDEKRGADDEQLMGASSASNSNIPGGIDVESSQMTQLQSSQAADLESFGEMDTSLKVDTPKGMGDSSGEEQGQMGINSDKQEENDDDDILSPKKKLKRMKAVGSDDEDSQSDDDKRLQSSGAADGEKIKGPDDMEDEEPTKEGEGDEDDDDDAPLPIMNDSKDDVEETRPLSDLPRGDTEIVRLQNLEKPKPDVKIYALRIPDVIEVSNEPETEISLDNASDPTVAKIRYKEEIDPTGKQIRQSNTRLVKWSDGTLQLIIGQHHFDVNEEHQDEQLKNRTFIFAEHGSDLRQCHGHVSANMRVSSDKAREILKTRAAVKHQKRDKAKNLTTQIIDTSEDFHTLRKMGMSEKTRQKAAARRHKRHDPQMTGDFMEDGLGGRNDQYDDDDSEEEDDSEAHDDDNYNRQYDDSDDEQRDRLMASKHMHHTALAAQQDSSSSDDDSSEEEDDGGTITRTITHQGLQSFQHNSDSDSDGSEASAQMQTKPKKSTFMIDDDDDD